MRAIVIDDDRDSVRSLSTLLEINGIEVDGKGYDGKEAIELYKKNQPDVVLLDMMMPTYDGKYAIRNLKKENKDVKIVVLTAYKNIYEFEENEVAAVLEKPYNISKVIEAMAK